MSKAEAVPLSEARRRFTVACAVVAWAPVPLAVYCTLDAPPGIGSIVAGIISAYWLAFALLCGSLAYRGWCRWLFNNIVASAGVASALLVSPLPFAWRFSDANQALTAIAESGHGYVPIPAGTFIISKIERRHGDTYLWISENGDAFVKTEADQRRRYGTANYYSLGDGWWYYYED